MDGEAYSAPKMGAGCFQEEGEEGDEDDAPLDWKCECGAPDRVVA